MLHVMNTVGRRKLCVGNQAGNKGHHCGASEGLDDPPDLFPDPPAPPKRSDKNNHGMSHAIGPQF